MTRSSGWDMSPMTAGKPPVDAVVLLGSRWDQLAQIPTRWHHVVRRWADHDGVRRVTVVDFPRFAADRPAVRRVASWLDGVDAFAVSLPLPRRRPVPLESAAWSWTARRLTAALGPAVGSRRLVVATTPLWTPLLRAWRGRARTGFDAYDDWRELPSMASALRRVRRGYADAAAADTITFGSAALGARLARDHGLTGEVVPNGVDVAAMTAGGAAPAGLPTEPFAVYLGVVQERVDVRLLAETARVVPTIVAGPVAASVEPDVVRAGVRCLGPVAPERVPGLLQRASVGIVPHVVNPLTASMDPIKIYEYRAAGLPVVATAVAGTDVEGVTVVRQPHEWGEAVRQALRRGRVPAAGLRDWSDVAEDLLACHAGRAARPATAGVSR